MRKWKWTHLRKGKNTCSVIFYLVFFPYFLRGIKSCIGTCNSLVFPSQTCQNFITQVCLSRFLFLFHFISHILFHSLYFSDLNASKCIMNFLFNFTYSESLKKKAARMCICLIWISFRRFPKVFGQSRK